MENQQSPLRTFGGGEYREIKPLGKGGFAEVILVTDRSEQQWALKLLREELIQQDPRTLERFTREAQIQQGLSNSHIARVETYNPEEGYLVIEYIEGMTLKDFLKRRFEYGMDLDTDLGMLREILQQLEIPLTYIHEEVGFAHLDITPSNILIQEKRSLLGATKQHIVLADFGLARVINEDGWAEVTVLAGTPGYWAPEQQGLTNDKPGKRSDIYTLGVVIGVILTNQKPQEVLDILRGTSNALPPNALPPEVKQVLQRAIAQNPRERYSTVKNLIADFMVAVNSYQVRQQRDRQPGSVDIGKTQKVPSRGGFPERSLFQGNPTGWRQRIVALYAILATFVIVGLAALLVVQSRPLTHPQPTLTPLVGLDLSAYCQSLTYTEFIGESACASPVDMNAACNWQYSRSDLHNQFSDPTNSDSGTCYDSRGTKLEKGIYDMAGYCKHLVSRGAPVDIANKLGTRAGWTCQQQIHATLACIWQFSRTDVEARNDQGNWICYALS